MGFLRPEHGHLSKVDLASMKRDAALKLYDHFHGEGADPLMAEIYMEIVARANNEIIRSRNS